MSAPPPFREKFSYAVGDAAFCLAWNGVSAFLFTSWLGCGIPSAVIGGLLLGGQVLTAFADLGVGILSDRWSRNGYRAWVRRSAPAIALLLVALFAAPPALTGCARVGAAAACYVLFLVAYSCGSIPFCSLLKTMTDEAAARVSFSAWRMTGAYLGACAVTTLFPLLSATWSPQVAVGVVALALYLGLRVSAAGVVERVRPPEIPAAAPRIGRVFFDRAFLCLFGAAVLFCAANAARFGALAVYAAETAAAPGWCAGGFACLTLASAAGAACVSGLSRRRNLRGILALVAVLAAGASGAVFVGGGAPSGGLLCAFVVVEFLSGMLPTLANVLVAGVADRQEAPLAGRLFAVWGLTGKLGNGLGAGAMALVLSAFPGPLGARIALSLLPAAFLLALPLLLIGGRRDA